MDLPAVHENGLVAEHDAFRCARRTAAEEQQPRVLACHLNIRPLVAGMFLHQVLQPDIVTLHLLQILPLLLLHQQGEHKFHKRRQVFLDAGGDEKTKIGTALYLFYCVVERGQHDGHFRSAVFESELKLRLAIQRVDGYRDSPGLPDSKLTNYNIRAVRHEHRHTVTFFDTDGNQPGGQHIAQMVYLLVCHPPPLEPDHAVAGFFFGHISHILEQGLVGIGL